MLQRLFFGLGVLLGLVHPQAAPELLSRIYRTDSAVYLNAELQGAFPEVARELAAEGTEVAVSVRARVDGTDTLVESLRSLRYDAPRGQWVVRAFPNGIWRLPSVEAAAILASRVEGLALGTFDDAVAPFSIEVEARPGILDEAGNWHPAGLLWGYVEPSRRFTFASVVEIPR